MTKRLIFILIAFAAFAAAVFLYLHRPFRARDSRGNVKLFSAEEKAQIRGVDADHNGIRDDVESFIQKEYSSSKAKQALARQVAAAYQAILPEAHRARELEKSTLERSYDCSEYLFGVDEGFAIIKSIERAVVNTPQRSEAWLRVGLALSGGFYGGKQPAADDCDFDAQGISK